MKRKLVKPFDIVLVFIVIICVVFLFLRSNTKSKTAIITVDGNIVYSVDLSTAKDRIFTLSEAPDVTVQIKNGSIRFINAACKDKICEKAGFLKNAGDTAACLPNKTVITIVGENNSFDGVSY